MVCTTQGWECKCHLSPWAEIYPFLSPEEEFALERFRFTVLNRYADELAGLSILGLSSAV